MSHLSVRLLGPVDITIDHQPFYEQRATKVVALLIYLALNRDSSHNREQLQYLLWPGMPQKSTQANLRQTLYRLRQSVPECATIDKSIKAPFLLVDRQTIQVNPASMFDLDVATFTALQVAKVEVDTTETQQRLERAAALYRGDFLSDFYMPDSNAFEAWAAGERENLRRYVLDILNELTVLLVSHDRLEEAEQYARRQLEIDNLKESGHRQLIEILASSGRRRAALSQYENCRQLLAIELGISPSAQTVSLGEAIRSGKFDQETTSKPGVGSLIHPGDHRDHLEHVEAYPLPNNLPPSPTPFIGREMELAALDELIADPDVSLVTVVGPGGMGKTRLALACAEGIVRDFAETHTPEPRFPDGVYFVPLTPLSNCEHIIPTLAEVLAFPIRGGATETRAPEQQMLDFLRNKQMLLVFDNFEHLLDGADLIYNMLETAPGLQILVTSRERLHLAREQLFPILGLKFPEIGEDDVSGAYAAVQLFLQTARRVQPDFAATDDDLISVAELCRHVDGMPLAIDLAASWVDTLSMVDILTEMERNLSILETEMRDIPPKHRSFRAAMDTSWQLLNPVEQATFPQLTVFQGGFSREAAQAVAVGTDGSPVSLKMLARLVNKSWLHYKRDDDRYQIHELIRQYGAEKLSQEPEEEMAACDRHTQYYCAFLSQRQADLKGGRQVEALAEIKNAWEEIDQAWTRAVQKGLFNLVEEVMFSLGCFYGMRGRIFDGQRAFERAAATVSKQSAGGEKGARILAMLLACQAGFCSEKERARQLLQQALSSLDRAASANQDVRWERAFVYLTQGFVVPLSYAYQARSYGEQSLALFRDVGDQWGIAAALNLLGHAELCAPHAPHYDRAHQFTVEGLRCSQVNGNHFGAMDSLMRLTYIAIQQGDFVMAEQFVRDSLAIESRIGNEGSASKEVVGQAKLLTRSGSIQRAWPSSGELHEVEGLGELLGRSGRYAEAYQILQECILIEERLDNQFAIAGYTIDLGFLSLNLGKYEKGRELAETGLVLCRHPGIGDELGIQWALQVLGIADLALGAYASARQLLQEGLDMTLAPIVKAGLMTYLGRVEFALGNLVEAQKNLYLGLYYGVDWHSYIELIEPLPFIALVLAEEGKWELAVEVYALAFHQPMIANSRLFADIAGTQLEAVAKELPLEVAEVARARGLEADPWQRASELLRELSELGWEIPT